jgi:hypothetical protein
VYAVAGTTGGDAARGQALAYRKAEPPSWENLARQWQELADQGRRRIAAARDDPRGPGRTIALKHRARNVARALRQARRCRAMAAREWQVPRFKWRCR